MSEPKTATRTEGLIQERRALSRVIDLAQQFIADGTADLGVQMTLESLLARDRMLEEAILAESSTGGSDDPPVALMLSDYRDIGLEVHQADVARTRQPHPVSPGMGKSCLITSKGTYPIAAF